MHIHMCVPQPGVAPVLECALPLWGPLLLMLGLLYCARSSALMELFSPHLSLCGMLHAGTVQGLAPRDP